MSQLINVVTCICSNPCVWFFDSEKLNFKAMEHMLHPNDKIHFALCSLSIDSFTKNRIERENQIHICMEHGMENGDTRHKENWSNSLHWIHENSNIDVRVFSLAIFLSLFCAVFHFFFSLNCLPQAKTYHSHFSFTRTHNKDFNPFPYWMNQ